MKDEAGREKQDARSKIILPLAPSCPFHLSCFLLHPFIRLVLAAFILASLLAGCQQVPTAMPMVELPPTRTSPTATFAPATPTQTPTPSSMPMTQPTQASQREIVILHTNDEHGALLPSESEDFLEGGAAYCAASWLRKGCDPNAPQGNVLLLSSGDNWTGQAISTWFHGQSTIEVMNAMGYKASVVGNHDLDAGQEVLQERIREAHFPYLAANLYRQGTEELVDWVKPYLIVEVNGVKVGIIGLALKETPDVTAAKHLEGLAFGDYEPALRHWVPVVRAQGAEIIVVEAHICPQDLAPLAKKVKDLGIALFEGGHCHQAAVTSVGGTLITAASSYWRDYVLTRLTYDTTTGKVVKSEQELVDVLYPKAASPASASEPVVQGIITKWDERTQTMLGEVIGYTATGLRKGSAALHNLLTDSWLWAYPQADVAMSNLGGFRQDLASGEITARDIVSVLPFENELYELEVKGKDILHALKTSGEPLVLGGIRREGEDKVILLKDGSPLKPEATYRLLITDYLYGNSGYPFKLQDSQPYETSISWRQPVIDWIRVQKSDKDNPLEKRLDHKPRQ